MAEPEAVIFCGIQGSGKTAFYVERFLHTHIRLSQDLLGTKRRQEVFLRACLETRQSFVVDRTNPTVEERRRYMDPAREAGFSLHGYFFDVSPRAAIARNRERPKAQRVPVPAILGTRKRLRAPTLAEGYDSLIRITLTPDGGFEEQSAELPSGRSPPSSRRPRRGAGP